MAVTASKRPYHRVVDGHKVCNTCLVRKPIDCFSKSGTNGRFPHCRPCRSESRRRAYAADPRAYIGPSRLRKMKYLYGITADQYRTLYANQGGRCAICDTFEPVEFKMSVDHDHACCPGEKACGKCVRGLLCNRCNVLLGHAQDNPDHLRRAIAYLGGQ